MDSMGNLVYDDNMEDILTNVEDIEDTEQEVDENWLLKMKVAWIWKGKL